MTCYLIRYNLCKSHREWSFNFWTVYVKKINKSLLQQKLWDKSYVVLFYRKLTKITNAFVGDFESYEMGNLKYKGDTKK